MAHWLHRTMPECQTAHGHDMSCHGLALSMYLRPARWRADFAVVLQVERGLFLHGHARQEAPIGVDQL